MGSLFTPQNCSLAGGSGPQPQWHIDRFSRLCRVDDRDRQTERLTDRPSNRLTDYATPSVTKGRNKYCGAG